MSSDPAAENLLERLKNRFSGNKGEDKRDHLVNEIEHLHKYKEITDNEFSMLEGILDFQDKMVREVMVPRPDAFMVDAAIPFQDNLDEILRQPYSRIPVYMKDKDKIVGIIHIRTVLRKARKIGFESLDYDNVMSEPLFAPETAELGELLVEMQQTQRQLAILLDEYGGVVGLATIEDLIEEIVGDIDDEVDHAEILFNKISENKYVIYGKMPLDDFNEEFKTNLEMDDVDTIAGYLITKLGIIPSKGEKLSVTLDNGMVLTTGRMKGSRLLTILLTVPEKVDRIKHAISSHVAGADDKMTELDKIVYVADNIEPEKEQKNNGEQTESQKKTDSLLAKIKNGEIENLDDCIQIIIEGKKKRAKNRGLPCNPLVDNILNTDDGERSK